MLVEELGLEPGRALRDLEAAILRQDPVLEVTPLALRRSRLSKPWLGPCEADRGKQHGIIAV